MKIVRYIKRTRVLFEKSGEIGQTALTDESLSKFTENPEVLVLHTKPFQLGDIYTADDRRKILEAI